MEYYLDSLITRYKSCKEYKMLPLGWSLYRAKKHDHVSPILYQLHWLPIRYRIQFKILSLVFLCINDLAPNSDLQELLVQYRPSRNLRSQSKSLLVSPRINTQFYGARSFQSSAPELWNNIPDKKKTSETIDQFKAALKTHYFMLNNWVI